MRKRHASQYANFGSLPLMSSKVILSLITYLSLDNSPCNSFVNSVSFFVFFYVIPHKNIKLKSIIGNTVMCYINH